jgi:hypothetical protein
MGKSAVGNAALMLRELSQPWGAGERVKSVLDRTSRLANLTYWRTYDLWYGKARRIEPHEIEQIAEALRVKNEKAARNEFHELKVRLARLEASLSTRDADFYSPSTDYARDMVRGYGGQDRPVARQVAHTHPKDPPK